MLQLGVFSPPDGGYEGRFILAVKNSGYYILNVNARGLGDVEAYLTKVTNAAVVRRTLFHPTRRWIRVEWRGGVPHKPREEAFVWQGSSSMEPSARS
jgi:hypothetical protein